MKKSSNQTAEDILEEKIARVQRRREWRRFITECAVIAAAVYLVFHYVIGLAFVSGHSMEPTLQDGELVVFYRIDEVYHRDDVVIVHREDGLEYIKRVAAEPGDVVELSEDGVLLVNGEPEDGSLVQGKTLPVSEDISYPYTVPEGSYFVLGDNRENSMDSREFGAVTQDEITGRVCFHLGMTQ